VPPNYQAKITFVVAAPQTPGSYGYQWAIVEEGVAWVLDQPSPQHTIVVQAPVQTGAALPRRTVELGGQKSAVDRASAVHRRHAERRHAELPAGVYLMTTPAQDRQAHDAAHGGTASSTVGCLPRGPDCAVLLADPAFDADNGLLQIALPAANVTVQHLVINGNRAARLSSARQPPVRRATTARAFNSFARGDGKQLQLQRLDQRALRHRHGVARAQRDPGRQPLREQRRPRKDQHVVRRPDHPRGEQARR